MLLSNVEKSYLCPFYPIVKESMHGLKFLTKKDLQQIFADNNHETGFPIMVPVPQVHWLFLKLRLTDDMKLDVTVMDSQPVKESWYQETIVTKILKNYDDFIANQKDGSSLNFDVSKVKHRDAYDDTDICTCMNLLNILYKYTLPLYKKTIEKWNQINLPSSLYHDNIMFVGSKLQSIIYDFNMNLIASMHVFHQSIFKRSHAPMLNIEVKLPYPPFNKDDLANLTQFILSSKLDPSKSDLLDLKPVDISGIGMGFINLILYDSGE